MTFWEKEVENIVVYAPTSIIIQCTCTLEVIFVSTVLTYCMSILGITMCVTVVIVVIYVGSIYM